MPDSKYVVGRSVYYRSPGAPRLARRFQMTTRLDSTPTSHRAILALPARIFAIFVLAIFTAGVHEFFTDDWFFLSHLQMQGLNYLTPQEVERASGIIGYNIFFVEPSAVERALKKIPEVKSAHVTPGIPDSVLVQIEERSPEMLWLRGDETYWVDAEGIAFKMRAPRSDLSIVRDLDAREVKVGKRVQPAAVAAFRALRAAWQNAPRNFAWSQAGGLMMTDEHGWKILFGDATDMEIKLAKLNALTPSLVSQGTKVKLIDLGKGDPYYQ